MPVDQSGDSSQISYNFTDLSQIEADVAAMETFASALAADVKHNYAPNMRHVTDAMLTEIPPPPADFVELYTFLYAHREAQDVTQQNVYNYANGTARFANAATQISDAYRGSDAFSHAKVTDVDKAFGQVGIPEPTDTIGYPPPPGDEGAL
jgi:hypothetical protein